MPRHLVATGVEFACHAVCAVLVRSKARSLHFCWASARHCARGRAIWCGRDVTRASILARRGLHACTRSEQTHQRQFTRTKNTHLQQCQQGQAQGRVLHQGPRPFAKNAAAGSKTDSHSSSSSWGGLDAAATARQISALARAGAKGKGVKQKHNGTRRREAGSTSRHPPAQGQHEQPSAALALETGLDHLERVCHGLDAEQTASTMYSLGNLGITGHPARHGLIRHSPSVVAGMSHMQLAQLLHGAARCRVDLTGPSVPGGCLPAIERRILDLPLGGFDGRCTSFMLWAYGELDGVVPSAHVSERLQQRLLHLARSQAINERDLSMCMWAFGKLSQRSRPAARGGAATGLKRPPKFAVSDALLDALEDNLCGSGSMARNLSPQSTANIIFSYHAMAIRPCSDVVGSLCYRALAMVPRMTVVELRQLLQGLQSLKIRMQSGLLRHVHHRLDAMWQERLGGLARRTYRADLTHQMSHVLLKMGVRPPESMVQELLAHMPRWLREHGPPKLVTTLWMCSQLGLGLGPENSRCAADAVASIAGRAPAHTLSALVSMVAFTRSLLRAVPEDSGKRHRGAAVAIDAERAVVTAAARSLGRMYAANVATAQQHAANDHGKPEPAPAGRGNMHRAGTLQPWVAKDKDARKLLSTMQLLFLSCRFDPDAALEAELANAVRKHPWLEEAAELAFTHDNAVRAATRASDFQTEVEAYARQRMHDLEAEFELGSTSGRYSVDLYSKQHNLAIEVDGPAHFIEYVDAQNQIQRYKNPSTAFKHRAIAASGVRLVSIPMHQWLETSLPRDRRGYFAAKMSVALDH